jgi:3-(3-hydroxy-phenyl)propionate hydroxylase
MNSPVHVLLVGGGPVGLVTALAMARAGLKVTVVEADAAYDERPRAATTHASTLEMLASLGLIDEVLRVGLVSPRFQHWDRVSGRKVAEFDYSLLKDDTPYPYVVQCESHKLVALAEAALAAFADARVLRRHTVTALEQTVDGVTATCSTPGGIEVFGADYVVGTDGARSVVRGAIGADFEGYTFDERFVGMTTRFDFEKHYGYSNRNYFSDPERWVAVFKVAGNDLNGLWRVISPATTAEADDVVLSESSLQERLQRFFPRAEPYDIDYRGVYRFHQRVASRFRHGRIFLAGDAAHINNPAGGLGLNGGIHDGMELTGILAAIMRGEAGLSLLDRYERRRKSLNIEYVQQDTVANKRRLEESDPEVRRQHQAELQAIASDPARCRQFLLRASLIESTRKAELIA